MPLKANAGAHQALQVLQVNRSRCSGCSASLAPSGIWVSYCSKTSASVSDCSMTGLAFSLPSVTRKTARSAPGGTSSRPRSNKPKIFLQAGHAGFRLFLIVAANRVVELAAAVAEGDAVQSGALFEPGHRNSLCKNPTFPVQRRDRNATANLPPKCPHFWHGGQRALAADVP